MIFVLEFVILQFNDNIAMKEAIVDYQIREEILIINDNPLLMSFKAESLVSCCHQLIDSPLGNIACLRRTREQNQQLLPLYKPNSPFSPET